ncbi:DNA endonuclease SmrA [Photobacterium phosphoreum]|jgi:DNA-nicking Smr family endonuclease|uniref:DNA endonuclease SmrA n=1 Tax=Photobacterium phosphoreum TaxID=659 RepID=A0AAW4ZRN9_PHOPO|nr:DNA endonuclease SmrA [Photobacterium phosphoreum]MCD9464024.1 DNA endonuclease SmrA [Photobacterium phosphoreum]MCD9481431.1 DNA endonuclease SmrA [Photobacterium phosphoreum]MCD9490784.1 DNA endonuclease SmrA [Photobacterium phosphoreum]MCF2190050.1 DNA endonuclease SmrA [Photobacterium phosphoreum]MCF2300741.1 DNA endonuclease SmrA [Photobacterium phosphoreum]
MSDREFDLFKEMMADVAPIKQDTILIQHKYQVSEAQLARRLAAQTLANNNIDYLSLDTAKMVKPDDMIEFKRDGVQQAVFKKMRQGKYDIHARLDLHKKTLSQARDEVLAFLKQSQRLDIRTVMIVHGKGERGNPQALMKSFITTWLEQISDVLCFHSAQRQHGGTGALYVMIKKSAEKKQQTRDRHINHRDA